MLPPESSIAAMTTEMLKLEFLISDLSNAGFKPNNWALRHISNTVSGYYFHLNKDSKKMKACLREVIVYPSPDPWHQIDNLMWLNQMIDIFRRGGNWATMDLPKDVEMRLEKVHWHLKGRFVDVIAKWLGEDSMVAKSAKQGFEELPNAPSWDKLKKEKPMFMSNLDALIEWANEPSI